MTQIMQCSMWNHGDCATCNLYEKKLCKGYPSATRNAMDDTFKALHVGPSPALADEDAPRKLEMSLMLVDMDKKTSRLCTIDDAAVWDWSSENKRTIDNWHVHSYERLLEILSEKAMKGATEVEIRETPSFLLISTGY